MIPTGSKIVSAVELRKSIISHMVKGWTFFLLADECPHSINFINAVLERLGNNRDHVRIWCLIDEVNKKQLPVVAFDPDAIHLDELCAMLLELGAYESDEGPSLEQLVAAARQATCLVLAGPGVINVHRDAAAMFFEKFVHNTTPEPKKYTPEMEETPDFSPIVFTKGVTPTVANLHSKTGWLRSGDPRFPLVRCVAWENFTNTGEYAWAIVMETRDAADMIHAFLMQKSNVAIDTDAVRKIATGTIVEFMLEITKTVEEGRLEAEASSNIHPAYKKESPDGEEKRTQEG
jgi:hypothetical protein